MNETSLSKLPENIRELSCDEQKSVKGGATSDYEEKRRAISGKKK